MCIEDLDLEDKVDMKKSNVYFDFVNILKLVLLDVFLVSKLVMVPRTCMNFYLFLVVKLRSWESLNWDKIMVSNCRQFHHMVKRPILLIATWRGCKM